MLAVKRIGWSGILAVLCAATMVHGQDKPLPLGHADFQPTPERPVGWRGDGTGCFPGATPVSEWDCETGKNVLWKVDVPYWGSTSPIVAKGKVITACEPGVLLCYDAQTGKLLWHNSSDQLDAALPPEKAKQIRQDWAKIVGRNSKKEDKKELAPFYQLGLHGSRQRGQGHTFATPICDGTNVYTAWGNNAVACYDLENGKLKWMQFWGEVVPAGNGLKKNIPHAQVSSWNERWAPSPMLVDGVLVAYQGAVMHGVDAETGKPLWTFRLAEHVDEIYREHDKLVRRDGPQGHWGAATPVKLDLDGTKVLITGQGTCIRIRDGKILSPYIGAMADVSGASPVADDERDIVYMFDYQEGGGGAVTEKTWAVKLSLEGPDKVTGKILWSNELNNQAASPILVDGVLYNNKLEGVDALTGAKKTGSPRRFGGGYTSPAYAGGLFFHFRTANGSVARPTEKGWASLGGGELRVVLGTQKDAGNLSEIMVERARQAVRDGILPYVDRTPTHGRWNDVYGSHPFFQGDRMYVRTRMALYCIGPKKADGQK